MPEITTFPGATAYDARGVPTIPANFPVDPAPQFKAAWIHIAKMGNRVVGATAERTAAAAWAWDGMTFYDTTLGAEFVRRSAAWKMTGNWNTSALTNSAPASVTIVRGDLTRDGEWAELDYHLEYIPVANMPLNTTLAMVPDGWRPATLRMGSPTGFNPTSQAVTAQMSIADTGALQMRGGTIRVAIGTMRWKIA